MKTIGLAIITHSTKTAEKSIHKHETLHYYVYMCSCYVLMCFQRCIFMDTHLDMYIYLVCKFACFRNTTRLLFCQILNLNTSTNTNRQSRECVCGFTSLIVIMFVLFHFQFLCQVHKLFAAQLHLLSCFYCLLLFLLSFLFFPLAGTFQNLHFFNSKYLGEYIDFFSFFFLFV